MEFAVNFKGTLPFSLAIEGRFAPDSYFIGVTGPSGAGKTTLLRCLAGLERQACVSASWQPAQARVGMVFQSPLLFPHLSVKENLLLAQKYALTSRYSFNDVIHACCCESLMNKYPATISGGEGQRVALARAILNSPDILLLDEALSAMDGALRKQILSYLKTLTANGLPVIFVSHDMRDIALYTDELMVLKQGQSEYIGKVDRAGGYCGSAGGETFCILEGDYVQTLPDDGIVEFSCHGQPVYAKAAVVVVKDRVRMVLDANKVSLERPPLSSSSVVNALTCEVSGFKQPADDTVLVTLKRHTSVIHALVSQFAFSKMQLQMGETVIARFPVNVA